MRKILLMSLMITSFATITKAQTKTGSLSGSVYTADGKAAPDVTVVLKNTSRGSITAEDGSFEIKRVPSGSYIVEISLLGYSTLTENVNISAGQQVALNFRLKLSAAELQQVTVKTGRSRYKVDQPSGSLRVQTPLLQLPQNVQIVTENVIRDQQIFDMSEAVTRNVSGATSASNESWGNYANLMMRGGTMTAFRNGMNVKMPWGPLVEDMSMVDRIEFVKGPAGFMLANGEPTGIYNIVTKKPTGINKGEANFTLGSFDTYRTTLDLDGKFSDDGKLLYRFNIMGQLKNSHRDFDFNNRYSIVPVLTYKFNEKTSLTAEYTYQYMKMAMLGSAYLFSLHMGDLPRDFTLLEPNLEPTDIKDHNLYLTLNHQLDSKWKLTTQLAYFNYQQKGSSMWPAYPVGIAPNGDLTRSISIWDAHSDARLGQVFLNGEVTTGAAEHRILAGLDMGYKNYYADFYQSDTISGYDMYGNSLPFNIYRPVHGFVPPSELPPFDRSVPLKQRGGGTMDESSSSLYAQDEISFAKDKIRLTLAGRYTRLKQHSFGPYSKDEKFTPRAGISISVDRSTSLYAIYDKSFVAQGGVDSARKPFVPVTGDNKEVGIKKDWFGGRWNTTLSAYRIMRNNVVTFIPGPDYKAIQTGQTKTQGVEFDLRGEISRGLALILNYAFTEAEVTKDADAGMVGGPVPGPGFPKHISNGWLSYRAPSGKIKGFGVSAGYQYLTGRQEKLPDYFRLDGNLSWQNNQVSITLNANNILNKYLYTGAPYEYNNDYSSTEYYFQVEPGINFRMSVGYKF